MTIKTTIFRFLLLFAAVFVSLGCLALNVPDLIEEAGLPAPASVISTNTPLARQSSGVPIPARSSERRENELQDSTEFDALLEDDYSVDEDEYYAEMEAQQTAIAKNREDLPSPLAVKQSAAVFEQVGVMGDGAFSELAFSPDESKFAAGTTSGVITVYSYPEQIELSRFESTSEILSLAWAPDNNLLAYGDNTGRVGVWNAAADTVQFTADIHTDYVRTLAWTSDSRQLASAGDDMTALIWDVATGTVEQTLAQHEDWIRTVAWDLDNQRLVTAGDDGTAIVWDVASGEALQTYTGHNGKWIYYTAWIPNSDLVVSALDSSYFYDEEIQDVLHLWDAKTGDVIATWTLPDTYIEYVGWDALTESIVVVAEAVYFFDGQTLVEKDRSPEITNSWFYHASYLPAARQVSLVVDNSIIVTDPWRGETLVTLQGELSNIEAVAFHPLSAEVLVSGGNSFISAWDLANSEQRRLDVQHTDWVRSMDVNQNNQLVSGGDDLSVVVYDLNSDAELVSVAEHTDWVRAVVWSPDGARFASTGDDGWIYIWDGVSGAVLQEINASENYLMSVAWSADAQYVAATGLDDTVSIWDAGSGELIEKLPDYSSGADAVVWSPTDPNLLAFGSTDLEAFVYDMREKAVVQYFDSTALAPDADGYWSYFTTLEWSPDGNWLAIGGSSSMVALWNTQTWERVSLQTDNTEVNDIAWRADSQALVAGLGNGAVVVWELRE